MSSGKVRCYGCRKTTPLAGHDCAHCGIPLHTFCGCGATHSVYATSCPECGAEYEPPRPRGRWRRVVGVGGALVVLGAVGFGAVLYVRDDPQKARWRAQQEAADDLAAERFESARVRLLSSLEAGGANPTTLYLLAFAENALGRHAEATRRAREVLDRNPDHAGANVLLVQTLLAQRDFDDAIEHGRRCVAAGLSDAALHASLAVALRQSGTGSPEEIEGHLRDAVALTKDPGPLHVQLGEWILVRAEAFPGAPLAPDAAAHVREARRLLARRFGDGADLDTYRLAARMDLLLADAGGLDELSGVIRAGDADASYSLLLARIAARAGQRDRAAALLSSVREDSASAADLLALHDVMTELGDADRAAAVLSVASSRFPDDAAVVMIAAHTALAAGDVGAAETRLRALLAVTPNQPQATVLLADVLAGDQRIDEARSLLRAAEKATGDAIVRLRLAGMLVSAARGDSEAAEAAAHAEARALVEGARADALGSPATAVLLRAVDGRLLLATGRPAQALRTLTQAGPDVLPDPTIHLLRARAHREMGAYSRAREEVTRAIELSARTPELLVMRARDALASGDAASASLDARAVTDGDPANVAARVVLAQALLARGAASEALAELGRLPPGADDAPAIAALRASAMTATGNAAASAGELQRAAARASTPDQVLHIGSLLAQARDRDAGAADSRNERAFLTDFVREHPDHERAAWQLAALLRRHDALAEARSVLDAALAHHPRSSDLLLARFESALAAQEDAAAEPATAERMSAALADAAQGSWQDLLVRGRLALGASDAPRALDLLRAAAAAAPARAKPHAFLALAAHRAGQVREARAAAERALEVGGDIELPKRVLADIVLSEARRAFDEGASAEALAAVSEVIGLNSSAGRGGLAVAAWQVARTGDRRLLLQARGECERLLGQLADDDVEERGRIWFALGNIARDLGDAPGFRTATEQHLRVAPDLPLAHARHAAALAAAGLSAQAVDAVAAAREQLGDDPTLLFAQTRLLGAAGRWADAERVARLWADAQPTSAEARTLLGQTLAQQRKARPAEDAFRAALALDAGATEAVRGLAALLVARNALDEAIALVGASVESASDAQRAGLSLLHANLQLRADAASTEALVTLAALGADKSAPLGVRLAATSILVDRHLRSGRASEAARVAGDAFSWIVNDAACGPDGPLAERAAAALANCGIATEQSGARAASRKFYSEALSRDPAQVVALNNLAEQLARSASTADQAVLLARRATETAPDVPEYRDSLGNALLADGQAAAAVAAYEAAIGLYEKRGAAAAGTLTGLPDTENAEITKRSLSRAEALLER